jgi:hypothetical protein
MEAKQGANSRAEYSDRRADCNANMALSGSFLGSKVLLREPLACYRLAGSRRLALTQTGQRHER